MSNVACGQETYCLQGFSTMFPLPDGTYDVVVVDAEVDDDGELHNEAAVPPRPHIGRIVALKKIHVETRRGPLDATDPYALLGVAGMLRVHHGVPVFRPETS